MPQMGESIAEGTLSRWIKKVGEAVKRDEPIFEISTDKVDAEIPAPTAGVLAEILVQEGETVAVQTVVARIETEAGAAAAVTKAPAAPSPGAPAPTQPGATRPAAPVGAGAGAPPTPLAPAPSKPAEAQAKPPHRPRRLARCRSAQLHPPRLRAVRSAMPPVAMARPRRPKSASSGSPLRWCVRWRPSTTSISAPSRAPAWPVESPRTTSRATSKAGSGEAGKRGSDRHAGRSGRAAVASPPPRARCPLSPAPTVDPWEGDRVEPWSRIRKLTADHMVMSRRVSPHVNTVFEIDYTRVAQIRARHKKDYADRGVNLTYLAFITKVVADNLRKHPVLNSAVSGESTLFRRDINIGIAVALDWGLIVPVIKHTDELSLLGVARAINDLGERARTKKLSPDEVQKGTFTITNPGVFGSVIGTPIINQPQAAILCVGTIEKQPAVITVDGTDMIAVRTRGMLSLAFDHRIVDGANADRFMADVKAGLQEFSESGA